VDRATRQRSLTSAPSLPHWPDHQPSPARGRL
jgi:hypothetical protein